MREIICPRCENPVSDGVYIVGEGLLHEECFEEAALELLQERDASLALVKTECDFVCPCCEDPIEEGSRAFRYYGEFRHCHCMEIYAAKALLESVNICFHADLQDVYTNVF